MPYDLSDNLIKLPDNLLESVNHLARTGKRIRKHGAKPQDRQGTIRWTSPAATVYAIAADPIAHVKTPQRLNALLRERGVDGVMVPFHVSPDGLPALFAGLRGLRNLGGLVVTVPHKEQAAVLCDEITPAARLIGAVNAIRLRDGKLAGGNFDGLGFVAGLRAQGHEPAGRRVYLAGLGGAGKAIACALAEAGPARLDLYNRSPNAPDAARLSAAYPRWTSAWPTSRPSPIARSPSTPLRWACPTPIPCPSPRCAARRRGRGRRRDEPRRHAARAAAARLRTHAGLHMLEGQIAEIARYLGIPESRRVRPPARSLDPRIHHTPFHGGDTHEIGFHHRPAVPGRHRPRRRPRPSRSA